MAWLDSQCITGWNLLYGLFIWPCPGPKREKNIILPVDRKKGMLPISCRGETKQDPKCSFKGFWSSFYCFLNFKITVIHLSQTGVPLASCSPLTSNDTFIPGMVSPLCSVGIGFRAWRNVSLILDLFLPKWDCATKIIWQITFLCWYLNSIHSHLILPTHCVI